MQSLKITKRPDKLTGSIYLPASKSISNRALIIQALSGRNFDIHNLSTADDTLLLNAILQTREKDIYIKNAGTAMRFLTAYFAVSDYEVMLSGSSRMSERPIAPLVDALRTLGAEIDYMEKEEYAPLFIRGKRLQGGEVSIDTSSSSQFASALLLIAPTLENGLKLKLEGKLVSEPYLDMTLKLMNYLGVQTVREGNIITIPHQPYLPKDIIVESDWSAASYWYALAACLPDSEVSFPLLKNDSLQGDSITHELMKQFGVETADYGNGIKITSSPKHPASFEYNFIHHPDLIPTFVSFCCTKGTPFLITGTHTLQYKESDRAAILVNELSKLADLSRDEDSLFSPAPNFRPSNSFLSTANDHRMAMSFAIAALKADIGIENPGCVMKSYPNFWEDMEKMGFKFEIFET